MNGPRTRGPGEAAAEQLRAGHDRTIDLEVPEDELTARYAATPAPPAPAGCGRLSVYARTVGPLGRGATLGG